jgi:hypothetical protein
MHPLTTGGGAANRGSNQVFCLSALRAQPALVSRQESPSALVRVEGGTSPGKAELHALVRHIAERIGRMLEKHGLIERDVENAWLSDQLAPAGSLDDLIGHSITYRIAVGPRAGQKVFTLQTVPAQGEGEGRNAAMVG